MDVENDKVADIYNINFRLPWVGYTHIDNKDKTWTNVWGKGVDKKERDHIERDGQSVFALHIEDSGASGEGISLIVKSDYLEDCDTKHIFGMSISDAHAEFIIKALTTILDFKKKRVGNENQKITS